jgi:sugar phosphate isomerase/epimerase
MSGVSAWHDLSHEKVDYFYPLPDQAMTRREILKKSAALGIFSALGWPLALGHPKPAPLKIGACDWSLGKDSDLGAFGVAKEIGLEGIMVNMGSVSNNLHLRNKTRQQQYLETSRRSGIKISSLALGEMNDIPYKSDPRTEEWVSDTIDVAKALNVSVILMAFFDKGDLRNDGPGIQEVIRRLRRIAPKAERMGITLGIESYLTAEELMNIIQHVGSRSIKVYYDFRNSADAGYDVIREIKLLGKDAICELHIKENGKLLGEGTLDWKKIGETLAEMDYQGDGWMQLEWARPEGAGVVESYKRNKKYLFEAFGYNP